MSSFLSWQLSSVLTTLNMTVAVLISGIRPRDFMISLILLYYQKNIDALNTPQLNQMRIVRNMQEIRQANGFLTHILAIF
jgi:hypothetical protein